jgi:hypothetical protein
MTRLQIRHIFLKNLVLEYVPCSLLHIDALGKPRRLGLLVLGASVNKNKYIF